MAGKLTCTPLQETDSDQLLEYKVGYLWSEPGTGKTLVMLRAIEKGGFTRIVVVAPPTALGMWQDELLTQLGREAIVLREDVRKATEVKGTPGTKAHASSEKKVAAYMERLNLARVIITSFNLAIKNKDFLQAFLAATPSHEESLCIIDEAHYCKSATAQRTMAVIGEPKVATFLDKRNKRIPSHVMDQMSRDNAFSAGFAHAASVTWQATGTPRTRWADDLWAQLYFGRKATLARHGALTYQQFVTKFCLTKEADYNGVRKQVIASDKNTKLLLALLKDCGVIRRTLEEAAAELPPLTQRLIRVPSTVQVPELTDEELAAGIKKKESPLAEMYKKTGVAKVPDVAEFLTDTYSGPTLVGFWHTDVGNGLRAAIRKEKPDWRVVMIDGSTPSQTRDLIRDDFNAGNIEVLLGQMEALSTSMNLQERAERVIMAEQLPSPATWQQFYQRVYRKGQSGHVQLDEVLADNALDKALRRVRHKKAASNANTVGQLGENK